MAYRDLEAEQELLESTLRAELWAERERVTPDRELDAVVFARLPKCMKEKNGTETRNIRRNPV